MSCKDGAPARSRFWVELVAPGGRHSCEVLYFVSAVVMNPLLQKNWLFA
jgi:hypothetical protein